MVLEDNVDVVQTKRDMKIILHNSNNLTNCDWGLVLIVVEATFTSTYTLTIESMNVSLWASSRFEDSSQVNVFVYVCVWALKLTSNLARAMNDPFDPLSLSLSFWFIPYTFCTFSYTFRRRRSWRNTFSFATKCVHVYSLCMYVYSNITRVWVSAFRNEALKRPPHCIIIIGIGISRRSIAHTRRTLTVHITRI